MGAGLLVFQDHAAIAMQGKHTRTSATIGFVALTLAACGGGSSGGLPAEDAVGDTSIVVTAESDEPLVVDTSGPTRPGNDVTMLDSTDFAPPGRRDEIAQADDLGDLLPAVFPTETTVDLAYAEAGAELMRDLNQALALPADIAVNFLDCGTANAFYAPPGFNAASGIVAAGGGIFMCHELTAAFSEVFLTLAKALPPVYSC